MVIFALSATLADGLLAGGDIDRWIVGMPAWEAVGVAGWANYSRLADLGNGFVLYPSKRMRTTPPRPSSNCITNPFEDYS